MKELKRVKSGEGSICATVRHLTRNYFIINNPVIVLADGAYSIN